MGLEIKTSEREILLELIDREMARIRQEQTNNKNSEYTEKLHQREDVLTHLIQKLSSERTDMKTPVREDHDELEKTAAVHDHNL
jgi:hypothetical protein